MLAQGVMYRTDVPKRKLEVFGALAQIEANNNELLEKKNTEGKLLRKVRSAHVHSQSQKTGAKVNSFNIRLNYSFRSALPFLRAKGD